MQLKACLTFSAVSFGILLNHKTMWFSNHRIDWIPFRSSGLLLCFYGHTVLPHTSGSCAAAAGLMLFCCHRKWAQCRSLDPKLTTRSVQGVKIWASPRTGSGMGAIDFLSIQDIHILVSCPNFLHNPVRMTAGTAHLVWHQTVAITPK